MVISRRFPFSATLSILLLLLWLSSCLPLAYGETQEGGEFVDQDDEDDDEGDEDEIWSEHERCEDDLYIDVAEQIGENVDLGATSPDVASALVAQALFKGSSLEQRLNTLFEKAKSKECRELIAEHYGYFVAALGREENVPFSHWTFPNTCPEPVYERDDELPVGMTDDNITDHSYQPPRDEVEYIDDPSHLNILYIVLTHDDPDSTIRLIERLYEDGHSFVIHVDGKEKSEPTFETIYQYAATKEYVHILPHPHRIRVNWGGFSMVNATLQALKYSFGLLPGSRELEFHKVVHLASTTYPIASNWEIRYQLSQFPLAANMMEIINYPVRTTNWYYFVECDDTIHRIHDLAIPTHLVAGFNLYTSSQWWIISREFAEYLATAKPGTFVNGYLEYIQHVVVADETFFGTVLKNTAFCETFHYRNFHFLKFDRWESDLPDSERDQRKCPMRHKDQCGRSPSVMTAEDASALELSDNLFARKFVQSKSDVIKDLIDVWRERRDEEMQQFIKDKKIGEPMLKGSQLDFQGQGVMIVAKETINDDIPLCLGVDFENNNENVWLTPCFVDSVPLPRSQGWEKGTVTTEETQDLIQWKIGPCSTADGHVEFESETGTMKVIPNGISQVGPRCVMSAIGRPSLCLDGYHSWRNEYPGDEVRIRDCSTPWSQLVSFGDGRVAPSGTLFMTIPHYVLDAIALKGHKQHKFMCLGVRERGDQDERDPELKDDSPQEPPKESSKQKSLPPLSKWLDHEIWMTRCTNAGALLEWVFVPYSNNGTSSQAPGRGDSECKEMDRP